MYLKENCCSGYLEIQKRDRITFFFVLFLVLHLHAQTALYNSGNLRIHEDGRIGFHTDLINENTFDENLGLAGFYNNTTIVISGAFTPIFNDVEIANSSGVQLQTSVNVLNNTNFILGDFNTSKNNPGIYFNFLDNAFYVGDTDGSKINGYAMLTKQQNFTFPVGDANFLRPLTINSLSINTSAQCAYFFENPNNPSSFPQFNTDLKPRTVSNISTLEFWRLEGSVSSTVTLSWNPRSSIINLTEDINAITIVGWNKLANRWLALGNTFISGDLNSGLVSSELFVPDDYEIVTLGSLAVPEDILTLENYILTPNNDGINDVLVIEELELSPNNTLQIFDRNGLKVFEFENYANEFEGISNINNLVINRDQGLPRGVYFYLVNMRDLGLSYQGFLVIER
ncbi:gliding motility-associated C-terminal domain-containing protein [Eudoraea chungangensis]|uniref:gliding motility-associated C-terminal domain-containing protein n=1 Tax=Eudoraea chungangensis TaxID=1481905 RepID=UPI0023EAE260|nr:gliding motility-associated C-terminal domain-containing protein [Eudoraea chungangensis]